MAAVRRSSRLSSIGCGPSATVTLTPRRSAIWRQRQTKQSADSDYDDDDVEEVLKVTIKPTLTESDDGSENNENCNVLNKMERRVQRRTSKATAASVAVTREESVDAQQQQKTPRRSKTTRTMPACKKRESAKKRTAKAAQTALSGDSDDDSDGAAVIEHEVSPPKQARHQSKVQHIISPSRLLDRLSIDERNECDASEEDEQLSQASSSSDTPKVSHLQKVIRNKYQNARRVLNSAETQNLPGREQQLQELRNFFDEHLREQRSGSLYVSGQPGTGKTACLSLLLRSPEYSKQLQCVYINCTSIASINGVYKKLCAELQLQPAGRTERDCIAAVQHHLRVARRTVLLVLDEIDQLCSSKQSVLYTIFEWPALPGAKLLLVGIANSLDLTERALMRLNARCELKPRHMHFPPYNKQQIIEIFRSRLEEAGVLDIFPPVTLQLLAAKVSAVSGDVRRALDIGRRVAEIAEQQMKAGQLEVNLEGITLIKSEVGGKQAAQLKPVQVTQVAAVLNKVYGASQNLQEDMEESFPLQQKIMLCTLMLMLRKERNKDISIGRMHEVYRRVCDKRNIHALDQSEFSGLVDLVETRGILRIQRKKEPRLNKVILQWDEEEVHGALRDKQLIASILDDTTCLGKY